MGLWVTTWGWGFPYPACGGVLSRCLGNKKRPGRTASSFRSLKREQASSGEAAVNVSMTDPTPWQRGWGGTGWTGLASRDELRHRVVKLNHSESLIVAEWKRRRAPLVLGLKDSSATPQIVGCLSVFLLRCHTKNVECGICRLPAIHTLCHTHWLCCYCVLICVQWFLLYTWHLLFCPSWRGILLCCSPEGFFTFFPMKGCLGVFPDPMWGQRSGMSICTDCKALWDKFVIMGYTNKLNWIGNMFWLVLWKITR